MSFHEPEIQLPLTTGLRYLNALKWTSLEEGDLSLHNAFSLISIPLSVPEKSSFKENPQFLMFPYGNVSLAGTGLSIARIHRPIPLYRRYAGQRRTPTQRLFLPLLAAYAFPGKKMGHNIFSDLQNFGHQSPRCVHFKQRASKSNISITGQWAIRLEIRHAFKNTFSTNIHRDYFKFSLFFPSRVFGSVSW